MELGSPIFYNLISIFTFAVAFQFAFDASLSYEEVTRRTMSSFHLIVL